jgi:hypothetical protein
MHTSELVGSTFVLSCIPLTCVGWYLLFSRKRTIAIRTFVAICVSWAIFAISIDLPYPIRGLHSWRDSTLPLINTILVFIGIFGTLTRGRHASATVMVGAIGVGRFSLLYAGFYVGLLVACAMGDCI